MKSFEETMKRHRKGVVIKYPDTSFRNPYKELVVSEIVCQVFTEEENSFHTARRSTHNICFMKFPVRLFFHSPYSRVIAPRDFHLKLHLNKFLFGELTFSGNATQTLCPISDGGLQRHWTTKIKPTL